MASLVVPYWLWVAVLCVVVPSPPSLPGVLYILIFQAASQLPFIVLSQGLLVPFDSLPLGPFFSGYAVLGTSVLPPR